MKKKVFTEGCIKCRCGHSMTIARDKKVCTWCGRLVYKHPEQEFKERLKSKLC